jgi:lipopolysaccharide export LptBFGC system permease protein LptF
MVIKFLAKALSILTYLPNYLVLSVVDHFLFDYKYRSSLAVYSAMWLPRMLLLFLGLALFCL